MSHHAAERALRGPVLSRKTSADSGHLGSALRPCVGTQLRATSSKSSMGQQGTDSTINRS